MAQSDADEIAVPDSLEGLKALIRERLEKSCADVAWYRWEIDEDIDISALAGQDMDKAKRLLFGGGDDVTGDYDERGWEYLQDARESIVKGELVQIIDRDLADVIEAFAEQNDLDADELSGELKEDSDFKPSELDVPDAYYNYRYQGKVSVVADLEISPTFTPDKQLLTALNYLRISPESYLVACRAFIERTKGEDDELTIDSPGVFEDCFAGHMHLSLFDDLFQAYEDAFWTAVKESNDGKLFLHLPWGSPAVSADDLVKFMSEHPDGPTIYLHTTCSGDTVTEVGEEMACHGLDASKTILQVHDAYLSPESNPAYLDTDVSMRLGAPLPVRVKDLSVRSDTPEDLRKEVSLDASALPGVQLYRALITDRNARSGAKRLSEADILQLVDALPLHVAAEMVENRALFKQEDLSQLVQAAKIRLIERATQPLTEDVRENGLIDCFSPRMDWEADSTGLALWLIDKGANVNARDEVTGVTPLMLAARRRNVAVTRALIAAGADVHVEVTEPLTGYAENALSIAARKETYNGAKESYLQVLVDAGARLPRSPLRVGKNLSGGALPLLVAVGVGHPEIVSRAAEDLKIGSENAQTVLNTALYAAGQKLNRDIAYVLVEHGADPAGEFVSPTGTRATVLDALKQYAKMSGRKEEEAASFIALLYAHRARRVIHGAASNIRAALGMSRAAP